MSFPELSDEQRAILGAAGARRQIIEEVLNECHRQVLLWGLQRRPVYNGIDVYDHVERFGGVIDTEMAKAICDLKMADGSASWTDIITEEHLEARDEAVKGDRAKLRTEWIQQAAVLISAIQDLDRTEAENANA